MAFTASQIAEQLRGEILGDGSVELTGLAPANCAKPGDLTFAEKETYFAAAEQSQATAILVAGEFTPSKKVLIRVPNARVAVPNCCRSFSRRTSTRPAFNRALPSPLRHRLIPRRTSDRTASSVHA